jgi:hypothetical protein
MGFPNAKHTIDKINIMQQTIVMHESMNTNDNEFWEFGLKNHRNRALDRKIWALEVFKEILGVFVEIWLVGKLWRERTGALTLFKNFWVIFGVF